MKSARFASLKNLLVAAPLAALALAGCQNDTVPGPESGTDYYPLEVGRYRVYAVADTLWNAYQRTPSSYQFRETVTDQVSDATGQPVFRVVRARRALPTDVWRDDSVMFVAATSKTLLLTSNNRRTVELVFPVRPDRAWNMYAFALVDTDSLTQGKDNRRYESVGQPFQTTVGGKPYRYEQTLTTALIVNNGNVYGADDEYYRSTYRQVYAKGAGPVYRVRRRFIYCDDQSPTCGKSNSRIYKGQARHEILIEQGKL
ncbi:hypothetical protein E5K00_04035 [Hymenobacter aquaticus]|uniref:Lipoprotein n=1 Tax=Hymenobacter aquaticus TaxID=1867101 RepID=A0A4Z0Q4I2_9BACT|nr:hypothetical protein [Hymenobacter aquaticus]TGE24396.1 hypothetical protein E5K00_04035 [Hymenobacter aquaticus]